MFALAWVTPPLLAALAVLAAVADEEVLVAVDDEELQAAAAATHAMARMLKDAFRSFIAVSPLRGRKARSRVSQRQPGSIDYPEYHAVSTGPSRGSLS
jgi:hypothetical protein